jgi:hypothetical protein
MTSDSGTEDTGDQYRWCIYCQADCWLEPENQQHTPSCPTLTGVYPVLPPGVGCTACHVRLHPGDVYTLADVDTETVNGCQSGFVVCLGCGAMAVPIR